MIKVMTLDTAKSRTGAGAQAEATFQGIRQAGIDLLCCQSVTSSYGEDNSARLLAESSGLICSCYAPPGRQPNDDDHGSEGLAMLSGPDVWVLNSGRLILPGCGGHPAWTAQFALLRKGRVSLLVFNLKLADQASTNKSQLHSLLGHPLCREAKTLVLVCADRRPRCTDGEFARLVNHANLHPQTDLIGDDNGWLCLLARSQAYEIGVLRDRGALAPGKTKEAVLAAPQFVAAAFEIRPKAQGRTRPLLPLSFREEWLGCREHFRAWAA